MFVHNLRYGAPGLSLLLLCATPSLAEDKDTTETLDPVIISGEIIGQTRMRTGTSVEVYNADSLEKRPGLNSVQDILENTTNVTMPTGAAKAATIRGIDGTGPAENANAFFAGSRTRLGLNIDGRSANFNEIVFGNQSLWDAESVQVLRGPQSTLVGRNAIAGTVAVKTRDPEFKYSGAAQVELGDHEGRRFSGMVNAPLIDNVLAARITADLQTAESAVSYQSFPGVSNPGDIRSVNLRGKILAHPDIADGSRLLITASHNSHKAPQGEIVVRPFEDRNSNFPQQPVHEPRTTSLGSSFEVDLDENWSFEMDASVSDFKFSRTVAPNTSNAEINATELDFDPRLRFSGDDGFEFLIGSHYFRSRQKEFIEFVSDQNFRDETDTFAIYGETIVPLSDTVELSVGGRYEREDRKRSGGDAAGAVATISSDKTFEEFLPRARLNWQPDASQSYGIQISKGYNAGGGGISFGFPVPFPVVHYEYDAETVWNYELYGRQNLLDDRLLLTQNLFFAQYSDMQLPFDLTPLDSRDELFVVRNADEVITYGAELGASYQYSNSLSFFGNVGLLQTKIKDFPNSGVEGNRLFLAPNVSANAGVLWEQNDLSASLSARYSGSYFTDINNRSGGEVDPFVVADARIGYSLGNIRFFGEVNNILDTDSPVTRYPGATSAADTAVLQQPRSFRVGMGVRF
ncbi:TonB-dependent receptor [Kiloniella sp. b19]|uniref:TonB-dependent receptor n=1 Tax=Kiloniella sp. GXU_MW_B19 TaxID=3141326 RepID=UPI0031E417CD